MYGILCEPDGIAKFFSDAGAARISNNSVALGPLFGDNQGTPQKATGWGMFPKNPETAGFVCPDEAFLPLLCRVIWATMAAP